MLSCFALPLPDYEIVMPNYTLVPQASAVIFVITLCHLRVWYRPSSNPVMTGRPRCDHAARPPVCSQFSLANLWLEAASVGVLFHFKPCKQSYSLAAD